MVRRWDQTDGLDNVMLDKDGRYVEFEDYMELERDYQKLNEAYCKLIRDNIERKRLNTYLQTRLDHLLKSKIIQHYDSKNYRTKEYEKNIYELDEIIIKAKKLGKLQTKIYLDNESEEI